MSTAPNKDALLKRLTTRGQQHLLAFWDKLSPLEQTALAAQIDSIDFDQLARLHEGSEEGEDWAALAARAQAPPAFRLDGVGNQFTSDEARARGRQALAAGKIGAILVAGGQGTRLGFEHPKGMYPVGPVSGAPLFQVLIERLLAVARRHGVKIPLYLMTSPATHDETIEFLAKHDRFGLPEDDLHVFCQGTMAALDATTGQVLLAAHGDVFLSPDGHGGMLAALESSGSFADIRRRGLTQLFYFQVDNPLAAVCDEEFIGYHILAGSELSTQVVRKQTPDERVGNVVSVDGQTRIIEYSDLPAEAGERRTKEGSLELWAGNIAVHVFDVAFLERVRGNAEGGLPFHVARKKVPYIDPATGQEVEPAAPNAKKFEQFIFDLLPAAKHAIVVEVDPAEKYSPVKNASGSDSNTRETAQAAMQAQARRWLQQAGAIVDNGVTIEISPLWALDAADAKRRAKPGERFTKDTYLSE